MICKACGRANELGARFCKSCGTPLESDEAGQQNNANQPYAAYQADNAHQQNNQQYDMPENQYISTTRMTKKEFDQCAKIKTITKNITFSAVLMYIVGLISLFTNVVVAGNIFGIIDIVLVVGLGLGIQLAKSRACAVIICTYSVINFIYMMILTGMPGGWLILVCAVYAIIYTFKYQNAWNRYQQTGQI